MRSVLLNDDSLHAKPLGSVLLLLFFPPSNSAKHLMSYLFDHWSMQVGLAGPSGAGKTAFARKIQALIPDVALLSMDNYNDGSKVIDGNFDDPRITDFDTLLSNLADLKAGRSAQVPIYDFKSSTRVGYTTVKVPTSRVIVLEGIYALSHRVRPFLDLRVSITGGVHFDLVKRVLRDIDRSGQAPEEIIQQVSDTVYPMYKAFIEPDLKAAHLRIYNPFNPFSGFMHPTYILKSGKPTSEADVLRILGEGVTRKTESEIYDIYLVPPGEDPETCQSWLRMRYRDGRYSLMFEEWVIEGDFIISPRVTFEVPVRILGGLMALGYEIGTIMQRNAESYTSDSLTIPLLPDAVLSDVVRRSTTTEGNGPSKETGSDGNTIDLDDDVSKADVAGKPGEGSEVEWSTSAAGPIGTEDSTSSMAACTQTKLKSPVTVKLDHIAGMNRCFVQVQGKDRAVVATVAAALGLKGTFIRHSYIELIQLENLTQSFQTVTEDLKRRFAVNGEPLIDEHVVGSFSRGSSPLVSSFPRTTGFAITSPSKGFSNQSRTTQHSHRSEDVDMPISAYGKPSTKLDQPMLSSSAPPPHSAPIPVKTSTPSGTQKKSGLLSQHINAFEENSSGGNRSIVFDRNGITGGSDANAGSITHPSRDQLRLMGDRTIRTASMASSGSAALSTPDDAHPRQASPSSPTGSVDSQMRKLVQTQQLLTNQMEELSVQLRVLSASLPRTGASEGDPSSSFDPSRPPHATPMANDTREHDGSGKDGVLGTDKAFFSVDAVTWQAIVQPDKMAYAALGALVGAGAVFALLGRRSHG